MPMLRATKSLKYKTRRMMAGDEFEASPRDARILIGARRAEKSDEVKVELEVAPRQAQPEPVQPSQPAGPTRSDIYRMRKDELTEFLHEHGRKVDEDDSVPTLRDQALALV